MRAGARLPARQYLHYPAASIRPERQQRALLSSATHFLTTMPTSTARAQLWKLSDRRQFPIAKMTGASSRRFSALLGRTAGSTSLGLASSGPASTAPTFASSKRTGGGAAGHPLSAPLSGPH